MRVSPNQNERRKPSRRQAPKPLASSGSHRAGELGRPGPCPDSAHLRACPRKNRRDLARGVPRNQPPDTSSRATEWFDSEVNQRYRPHRVTFDRWCRAHEREASGRPCVKHTVHTTKPPSSHQGQGDRASRCQPHIDSRNKLAEAASGIGSSSSARNVPNTPHRQSGNVCASSMSRRAHSSKVHRCPLGDHSREARPPSHGFFLCGWSQSRIIRLAHRRSCYHCGLRSIRA